MTEADTGRISSRQSQNDADARHIDWGSVTHQAEWRPLSGLFPLAPPDLRWRSATDYGIEQNISQERWHAGHVNAVCAHGPAVLVGTDSGGVWLVNPDYDAVPQTQSFPAQPLSWDWPSPNISAMVAGPDGPEVVFTGGEWIGGADTAVHLIQLKTVVGGLELVQTQPVPSPLEVSVWGIVTLPEPRRIVLATSNGVYWSALPSDPTQVASYSWMKASGFPDRECKGMALGPGGSVVAASEGTGVPGDAASGMFVGTWSRTGLSFAATTIDGPPIGISRTSVASCASDRQVVYAVAADSQNNAIATVLRSTNGGATWSPCPAIPTGPGAGGQGWYNNCIAVHPDISDIVAVGWGTVYLSTEQGTTWEVRSDADAAGHMHNDVHALVFESVGDAIGLFAGTDGGVCLSNDLGGTWDSRYNKHLRNLQFFGADDRGHWSQDGKTLYQADAATLDASVDVPGLFGGATQDNGNLWCVSSDSAVRASLRQFEGGDGDTVCFVGDGILHRNNTLQVNGVEVGYYIRRSNWFAGPKTVDDALGTIVPAAGFPGGLPFPSAVGAVRQPSFSRDGRRLLAVAAKDLDVFGYLEGADPGDIVRLASIPPAAAVTPGQHPRAVQSVASWDGSAVLAGTSDGHIFRCDNKTGAVADETVNIGGWAGFSITRLIWTGDEDRFGTVGSNIVIRWRDGAWEHAPGSVGAAVAGIEYETQVTDGTLIACTDFGVRVSIDRGDTWIDANAGLPNRPHCTGIRLGIGIGGQPVLYLGTWGWSVFITELPRAQDDGLQGVLHNIPVAVVEILLGIIQDGGGVEIRGRHGRKVPPRGPARELAVALAMAGLANQLQGESRRAGREFTQQLIARLQDLDTRAEPEEA